MDRAALEQIVEMTSMAPMAFPPHEVGVVVFDSREKVRKLAAETITAMWAARPWMGRIMLALMRPFMGKSKYAMMRDFVVPFADVVLTSHKQDNDKLLYDVPAAMLFHSSPRADPADAVIAATYAMLAAESLRLGTCLIGMVAPFLGRRAAWRSEHGILAENRLELVLVMGHPAMRPKHGLKRGLAGVTWAR